MPTTLPARKIGNDEVSAIGYGAMSVAGLYAQKLSEQDRMELLDAVYENGVTFWDTADAYGDSEVVLGKWFKRTGKRDHIFLATKFGVASGIPGRVVCGDPDYVPKAIDKSLERLGVDYVDLWYLHRADTTVPIELTVRAMAEQVKAGKVKHIGLSEVSAATLRRAHAVHPIAAVQVEYSPFTLDIEDEKIGLLKAARELGVAIVAYSPLGRGLLTGKIRSPHQETRREPGAAYGPTWLDGAMETAPHHMETPGLHRVLDVAFPRASCATPCSRLPRYASQKLSMSFERGLVHAWILFVAVREWTLARWRTSPQMEAPGAMDPASPSGGFGVS